VVLDAAALGVSIGRRVCDHKFASESLSRGADQIQTPPLRFFGAETLFQHPLSTRPSVARVGGGVRMGPLVKTITPRDSSNRLNQNAG